MNATISPAEADYAVLSDTDTVRLQRVLPGPIERVWQHLTNAGLRRQWLAGGDDVQPRAGTSFELVWRNDELTDPPGKHPDGFADEQRMQSRVIECDPPRRLRSEEHTSELQALMRNSYAVFGLKKKKKK